MPIQFARHSPFSPLNRSTFRPKLLISWTYIHYIISYLSPTTKYAYAMYVIEPSAHRPHSGHNREQVFIPTSSRDVHFL